MNSEDWIGRVSTETDIMTPRLVAEFRATLGQFAHTDMPGLQWAVSPEIRPYEDLGRDAHPRLGLVLPDLGLPRRMWAGGQVIWRRPLVAGDTVTRTTTVADITYKTGRSGRLGFLTLEHCYSVAGETRIEERQDIVYREDPDPEATAPAPPVAEDWPDATGQDISPNSTMLFRYSAMTFNGHRIHYDADYARKVEGYAGLVVHGPMQATWMHALAAQIKGGVPRNFAYRGLSPMTLPSKARVEARETTPGTLALRVRDVVQNVVTMQAEAEFQA